MKIGITGAKGFIGKHIIGALEGKKNVKLSYCDLPGCDVLKQGFLKNFVKNKDVIIHAAAINRGTDTEVIAGTVAAVYNLISAVEKLKNRPKIIYLSSVQAETETIYGLSKKLAEIMLKDFSGRMKAPVSIFRLANVFGEGCKPFYNSAVATFCYQVVNGEKLIVHPQSRNKKLNLVYVKEIADLITKEAFIKRKDKFYFKRIFSKNEIKVGELAKLIELFKFGKPRLKSEFEKDLYKTYLSYLCSVVKRR
ncbi:hypothetical protein COS61_00415 [Candidatus Wolfebacteria bacterium CG03_land_8_20_14_0_80_40_12]|uniref:NAD-dependent epimerase/dehydratase domain-containing protein n=1 Tax=Candidatus Wolfebacteria bacterium CG03_land_8_20_14_0_80_40_12 TaxID=1975069 RepID=A0A2M7B6E0_9BACT|nr:MAG: hypothetical protein COS61_00415 [Candidatus Wolfebacteria bacterium CG03_land_8_20_14_0_80_40_12]